MWIKIVNKTVILCFFLFFAFFPRKKYGICGWLVSIVYWLTKFKFYNPQSREYQSAVRLLLTNSLIYSIFYISFPSLPFWNKRASLCFLVIPQWGDEDNELSGQVPFNAMGLKAQEYCRLNLWFLRKHQPPKMYISLSSTISKMNYFKGYLKNHCLWIKTLKL